MIEMFKKKNSNKISKKKIKKAVFKQFVKVMCFIAYVALIEFLVLETNDNEDKLYEVLIKSESVKKTCGGELTGKGATLTSVSVGRSAVILLGNGATLG